MNKVEELLYGAGERGLSLKQLKNILLLSKNEVKYFINTSRCIDDVNPLIHGSCKSKIKVFKSCEENKLNYIKRKIRKFKKIVKVENTTEPDVTLSV